MTPTHPVAGEVALALWGLAGALTYGLYMVLQAFRTPDANPGARTSALLELALGVFVGPLTSLVFTGGVLFWAPRLDPRAVSVTLGLISVPALPRFIRWAQRTLFARLGDASPKGDKP